MQQLTTKISLSQVDFPFCNRVSIESSFNNLTDIAKIVVPRKISFRDASGNIVNNITVGQDALFKRGDVATIDLGYDHITERRFTGLISGVKTKFPLDFDCEDNMYILKRDRVTLSLKNPSLSELMSQVIPEGIEYEVTAEQNLGDFRITTSTPARVLDELRRKHGIYSFFRDEVLYIGLAVVPALQKTVRFTIFQDIINANSLTFVNDFDRQIKVVAKSILDDNTQLEAEAGDEEGEIRTVYLYNVDNIEDLQKKADSMVEQLRYSGYEGSFLTFLTPSVNHGDIIEVINNEIPEQSGGYICEKVTITSGVSGGRQSIEIKQKVYDLIKNSSGEWVRT